MNTTTDWITAIATFVAAVGTVGALAYAAKAAAAASRSATAARLTLAAADRPVMIDVPHERYTDYEHEYPWPPEGTRATAWRGEIIVDAELGTFAFPVRNVGRGPAVILRFSFTLEAAGAVYSQAGGGTVAAGEDHWLSAEPEPGGAIREALAQTPSPTHVQMPYLFAVEYSDLSGGQRQRLELAVGSRLGQTRLSVLRTKNYSLDPA